MLILTCIHLLGNPDYVIDAIDNINTKIDLIKYCHDKKLPVISSMGAGAKADPSRIQIADISETFGKFRKLHFIIL
jgi:tRNA A37 threonylcarbamoyladenosine dehydratase